MTRFLISALGLGVALISTMPAAAQDETAKISVSYADLNLASTAGAVTLEHRVLAAVTEICGSPNEINLQRRALINACRRQVRAGVDGQVQSAVASARRAPLLASAQTFTSAAR